MGKSTYYDWLKQRKPNYRCIDFQALADIENSFAKSGKTYGWRRIKADLKASYSHKKITRLMRFLKLKVNNYKKPLKKIIKPEVLGKYDRLIKNKTDLTNYGDVFSVDITEKIINGVKLHTCGFFHMKEKKIYGLVTNKNKGINLVVNSFMKLVDEFGVFKSNSIVHSDNGSEFKSYTYKLMLMYFDIKISMSRVGRSTDNGYIEGFWSTLIREAIIENYTYLSTDEYMYNFSLYSKFYNNDRIKL